MEKPIPIPDSIDTDLSAAEINLYQVVRDTIPGLNLPEPISFSNKSKATKFAIATASAPNALKNVKFTLLDAQLLYIDHSYQCIESRNIWSLINIYDSNMFGTIEVSYRNGKLFVVNGVHRVVAAIVNGEQYLLAKIHTDWTQEQESEMFWHQNDNVTPLNPL